MRACASWGGSRWRSRSLRSPSQHPRERRAAATTLCGAGGAELLLVDGRLRAEVRGPIAQLHVTQMFSNPFDRPIEALYALPLPHDGAVGTMTMRIGTRTIRAKIKRRAEARAMYESAK